MSDELRCQRPDRHVPGLICGFPLPCPWHTVTIDVTGEVPTVTIPVARIPPINPQTLELLKDISQAIHEEDDYRPMRREQERGKMPVGSDAKAKAAKKSTYASERAGRAISRRASGIRNRRHKR